MNDELPAVVLPETIADLGEVDPTPLEVLLERFTERFWEVEDSRKENDFQVFHSTDHLVFRFLADASDPRTSYDRPSWPIVAPVLEPVMEHVVRPLGLGRPIFCKAMFARLRPHAEIDRHRDSARGNELCHKIHVPVITNPDAWFQSGDDRQHLARGRAYEVNNVRSHGAGNDGDDARVHFIFEVFDGATHPSSPS